MSFITFQQGCRECGKSWNAAFGIVGRQQIASPSTHCPYCNSSEIEKVADGWKPSPPSQDSEAGAP
jgi:DNA-directed RNA polymerase subunit RPC12/RpoP